MVPHSGTVLNLAHVHFQGWLRQANERRRYKVKPSLIGWAQT